jgi:UPF0755 protein
VFNLPKKIKNRAIALVAIALVLGIFIPLFYIIYIPVNSGNLPIKVVVEEGQGSKAIAGTLKESGLIRSELFFTLYVKLSGYDGQLKAGKYNLSGKLNIPDLAYILVNGLSESDDIRILISEGFNIWEIDQRLADLDLIKAGEFSSAYHNEEGYLFPDTYRMNAEAGGSEFAEIFRERMRDNFNNKTGKLLAGLSLAESKEIIIIASILEKEARTEKDMKLVSGIIRNRIQLGMPLQVDATVIYGACWRKSQENGFTKNCDVTHQGPAIEIKIDGPYNSYTRKGLPPEPIANPGLKAIEAALNPTESKYLYYLTPRGTSDIIYSKTPAEHAANRRKYLGI